MTTAIYYHFRQRFNVSAGKAYEWCTSFSPEDHALMSEKDARRKIDHLTVRTVLLTDTFKIGTADQVEKQKLVQLYPETLFWTSTHLTGPARHSQFIYQINSEGEKASNLDFTGIFMDYAHENLSSEDTVRLSALVCNEDAAAWSLLAQAMERDLVGSCSLKRN